MRENILYKSNLMNFATDDLDETGTFSGYASVFDCIDFHNDRVMAGAFANSLREWGDKGDLPKMLWQHDERTPVGKWLELYEDATGLFAKGKLLTDTSAGFDAYRLLKHGVVDGLSIGFSIEKFAIAKEGHKLINEVDLREISLVTFAANPKAKVTSVKNDSPEREISARLDELSGKLEKIKA